MSDEDEGDLGDLGDILSQGDIDALMAEADGSEESGSYGTIFSHEGERFPSSAAVNVNICDFRNPVFLTESEMRQVRIRHESFIHYMAARLSMFIRMDVSMKMSRLHTMSYEEFTEGIPTPTFINLFRINPLNGVGVISINPRLAMTLVNRMLGGKGHSITDERYLTGIEMALVEDGVRVILDEWCNQWEEMEGLQGRVVGRENNGRFLQTSAHDAVMLVLDVEAALGDCSEQIQLGVPYYTIEPMIKKMKERNKEIGRAASKPKAASWNSRIQEIEVPVSAEWDAFEIPVSDLLRLREGDILEMPRGIIGETMVRVNDSARFKGEVGVEGEQVAVRLTETLEQVEE